MVNIQVPLRMNENGRAMHVRFSYGREPKVYVKWNGRAQKWYGNFQDDRLADFYPALQSAWEYRRWKKNLLPSWNAKTKMVWVSLIPSEYPVLYATATSGRFYKRYNWWIGKTPTTPEEQLIHQEYLLRYPDTLKAQVYRHHPKGIQTLSQLSEAILTNHEVDCSKKTLERRIGSVLPFRLGALSYTAHECKHKQRSYKGIKVERGEEDGS